MEYDLAAEDETWHRAGIASEGILVILQQTAELCLLRNVHRLHLLQFAAQMVSLTILHFP